jgi:hypothetical protein
LTDGVKATSLGWLRSMGNSPEWYTGYMPFHKKLVLANFGSYRFVFWNIEWTALPL